MKIKFKLPDRLIKLAKLANNNPNEHEANLAARRVCKMLEETKYEYTLEVSQQTQPVSTQGRTYNDIRRTTEPQWKPYPPNPNPGRPFSRENIRPPKSSRPSAYGPPFSSYYDDVSENTDDIFNDILDRMKKEEEKLRKEEEERAKHYREGDWEIPFFKEKKEKLKRTLTCKTCKNERETVFMGIPELFECNDCQWSIFEEERKKTEKEYKEQDKEEMKRRIKFGD